MIASRGRAALAITLLELAIALPFIRISPSTVRVGPGPLLIVVCMAASYALGWRLGLPLTILGVALGVFVIHENAVATPLIWIPTAMLAGLVGDNVRRREKLRHLLVSELRSGLVALSRAPRVGPVTVISRYVPAERAQLLAGDFYGVVAGPNGDVALMVGDVSGHGPEAAAVATHLRAGWRALAVAGVSSSEILRVLNDALLSEQRAAGTTRFATVCLVSVSANLSTITLALAGHPPPVLVAPDLVAEVNAVRGPPLGVVEGFAWPAPDVPLPAGLWSLMLYTDGLVEGRSEPSGPRPLGVTRLNELLAAFDLPLVESDVDALLETTRVANGGPMNDDVVVLVVSPAEPLGGRPRSA